MYELDCEFCETTVRSECVESLNTEAEAHLRTNHYPDVLSVLGERYDGVPCRNDCGYTVPIGVEEVAGADCPNCGHDTVSSLLGQYVYWRIERT
jgi:hypothetical protein